MDRRHALLLATLTGATGCLSLGGAERPAPVVPTLAVKATVRVLAPRWQAAPLEGIVADLRRDSVWLLVEAPAQAPSSWVRPVASGPGAPSGPSVVGVPTSCITEIAAWEEGSRAAGASRGAFLGALTGAAVGLLASPEPTAWKVQTLPLALPAVAVGTAVGTGLGWSRAGGRWVPVQLGTPDGPAPGPCVARAAPKKAPAKPTIAGKK